MRLPIHSRKPGAVHRATRYRWTLAEYSRTIFMVQPLGLRFPSPGSESKIIPDDPADGDAWLYLVVPAQSQRMRRVSSLAPGRVRIASHFRATEKKRQSPALAAAEGYARKSIRAHALFRSGDYSRLPGRDHGLRRPLPQRPEKPEGLFPGW